MGKLKMQVRKSPRTTRKRRYSNSPKERCKVVIKIKKSKRKKSKRKSRRTRSDGCGDGCGE